ncbi:hypothetical protein FQA39_LY07653 [Lamprigera yunnana]|nr:hypothetical protein FQA39_LY07653 [Lamprigera yunnana]
MIFLFSMLSNSGLSNRVVPELPAIGSSIDEPFVEIQSESSTVDSVELLDPLFMDLSPNNAEENEYEQHPDTTDSHMNEKQVANKYTDGDHHKVSTPVHTSKSHEQYNKWETFGKFVSDEIQNIKHLKLQATCKRRIISILQEFQQMDEEL